MSFRRYRTVLRLLALITFFVGSSSVVRAQRGLEELERELRTKHRAVLAELLRGTVAADDAKPEHKDALNAQTEYLARRFVDPIFQSTPPGSTERSKTMAYLIDHARIDVDELNRFKANNQAAAKLYTHYFCVHAKAVLLTDPKRTPVSSLNLMRALANLAVLGQGELGDVLVDVIEEDLKKDQLPEAERLKSTENLPNDGVKYYALRGLQDLLAQPAKPSGDPFLTKEQEVKVAKLLIKIITTVQKFKDGTTQQEIDGYRVRRREAIKALAYLMKPAVPDKKDGAALTLLRVVARDKSLAPEPTIEERLEAAVGLARMKLEQDKDYNSDYALYHIGLFLDEFVTFCNTENATYQRPIRIYSARLLEALLTIKPQLDDPTIRRTDAEKKYTLDAIDQCGLVLTRLEKLPAMGKLDKNGYKLDAWFADNKVPNTQLFKGVAGTDVAPPTKKE